MNRAEHGTPDHRARQPLNSLPRTVVRGADGGLTTGGVAPLVSAAERYRAMRRAARRWFLAGAAVLLAGAAASAVVASYAGISGPGDGGGPDHLAILVSFGGPLFIPAVFWLFFVYPFRRLPRLDPQTHQATVAGLHIVTESHDGSADDRRPSYCLVELRIDPVPGDGESVLLADVVAEQDLDRFAPGTTWRVRLFEKPCARALLAVEHDDVVRIGYDLRRLRFGATSVSTVSAGKASEAAGPGSVPLLWAKR